MTKAADAKELLGLETLYQRGKLDEKASARWNELANAIFADARPQARRSFRLPVEATATITVGKGTFTCTIVEISRLGLTLQGPVFGYITHEETVRVCDVTFDRKAQRVDLHCRIVRFDGKKTPPVVGVTIADDTAQAARAGFFDRVYYPLYLKYLEKLAAKKN